MSSKGCMDMTTIPSISVQLVHMQGPLKGQIQEFLDQEILIGRHPDCQVSFPRELTTLSRVHAKIVKEGNRFKVVDQSTNGTYVNGQKISETYLKDGDVVMFSEGGPKVSFLTQTQSHPSSPPMSPEPTRLPEPVPRPAAKPRTPPLQDQTPPVRLAPASERQPEVAGHRQQAPVSHSPSPPPVPEKVKVPFAIQYGPALKSFHSLPIVIGNGSTCDFRIPHASLNERQAQILFAADQYWIKDLTGTGAILINGHPIGEQAPLEPDMQLSLSPTGPKFRFIAGGRLAEIEDAVPEPPPSSPQTDPTLKPMMSPNEGLGQKAGSLFKKIFGKEPT
jgi:pSer/pThr/pTyr-binding forkhead associated (FHA) protein